VRRLNFLPLCRSSLSVVLFCEFYRLRCLGPYSDEIVAFMISLIEAHFRWADTHFFCSVYCQSGFSVDTTLMQLVLISGSLCLFPSGCLFVKGKSSPSSLNGPSFAQTPFIIYPVFTTPSSRSFFSPPPRVLGPSSLLFTLVPHLSRNVGCFSFSSGP